MACRLGRAIETVKVSALNSYNIGIIKQTQSQANEKETLPANAVRQQEMLLSAHVEDYVSQHNGVRTIDAYVNTLDLLALGFKNTQPVLGAGQPAYSPEALLKFYLYGYLQGIRSSRKLENEVSRNLEVIWLIEVSLA